jgi:hypothetical protein
MNILRTFSPHLLGPFEPLVNRLTTLIYSNTDYFFLEATVKSFNGEFHS